MREGSPAGVYRAWMLDKQSSRLIVLEAGSLEWRKQVLGDDCRVLKLPWWLFCTLWLGPSESVGMLEDCSFHLESTLNQTRLGGGVQAQK